MNPRFTHGPWAIRGTHPDTQIVMTDRDEIIARIQPWTQETDLADAHLIAAAPEMYEVLQKMLEHWESGNFSRRAGHWQAMSDVLAKARGEQ